MTIRSELENPIVQYCQANPTIGIALEGQSFDRTKFQEYVQIVFLNKAISNPTVEFSRKRTRGFMQVSVYVQDKTGSKRVEELAEIVASLYPSYNKQAFASISIEEHPQIGRAMIDANFRFVPITIAYRQES